MVIEDMNVLKLLYDFSYSFLFKVTKGNKPSSKFCTERLAILDLVCKLARVSCFL